MDFSPVYDREPHPDLDLEKIIEIVWVVWPPPLQFVNQSISLKLRRYCNVHEFLCAKWVNTEGCPVQQIWRHYACMWICQTSGLLLDCHWAMLDTYTDMGAASGKAAISVQRHQIQSKQFPHQTETLCCYCNFLNLSISEVCDLANVLINWVLCLEHSMEATTEQKLERVWQCLQKLCVFILASQITSTCHIIIPLHHLALYFMEAFWALCMNESIIDFFNWLHLLSGSQHHDRGFPLLLEMWQKLRMQIL